MAPFGTVIGPTSGQARHIPVFFTDLFGMTRRYNRPGEVNDKNWMLRIADDFEQHYGEQCTRGTALDMRKCFALALEVQIRMRRSRCVNDRERNCRV